MKSNMEIPIQEIRRLIDQGKGMTTELVYIPLAQRLRNQADDIEQTEEDRRIIDKWLRDIVLKGRDN